MIETLVRVFSPVTLDDYLALPYRMEIVPDDQGYFFINYPDLPGCMTQVEDINDAVPMARDALQLWLEVKLEYGDPIPLPKPPETYSGKFLLRIRKSLHRALSEEAEADGVSLNGYAAAILESRHRRPMSGQVREPAIENGPNPISTS